MKRYINKSKQQAAIIFEVDGEEVVQYLRRGQVFETDVEIKRIRGDVEVVEVSTSKK